MIKRKHLANKTKTKRRLKLARNMEKNVKKKRHRLRLWRKISMRCHRKMSRNRGDKLKICTRIDRLKSVCLLCSPRAAVIKWLALFYVCMWFWCASISLLSSTIHTKTLHFFSDDSFFSFFSQLFPVSVYSVEFYNSITARLAKHTTEDGPHVL